MIPAVNCTPVKITHGKKVGPETSDGVLGHFCEQEVDKESESEVLNSLASLSTTFLYHGQVDDEDEKYGPQDAHTQQNGRWHSVGFQWMG